MKVLFAVATILSLLSGCRNASADSSNGRADLKQEASHGTYEAKLLVPKEKMNIERTLDTHVREKSEAYSDPGAGYEYSYTCQADDGTNIVCAASYSDGGGLLGVAMFAFQREGELSELLLDRQGR